MIEARIDNLIKKIDYLKDNLTSPEGILHKDLEKIGDKIVNQGVRRFSTKYAGRAPSVINALKVAGFELAHDNDDVTLMLFDKDKLDALTALAPTVKDGKIFHLWRLLHAGFGSRADSKDFAFLGTKKTQRYPVQAIVQTTSLEAYEPGRYAPYPDLLAAESSGVIIIRHPGARGKEWILRNSDIVLQDKRAFTSGVSKSLEKIAKGFNRL